MSAAPASVVAAARRRTASDSAESHSGLPAVTRDALTSPATRARACRLPRTGDAAARFTAAAPASTRAALKRPGFAAVPSEHAASTRPAISVRLRFRVALCICRSSNVSANLGVIIIRLATTFGGAQLAQSRLLLRAQCVLDANEERRLLLLH